MKNQNKFTLFGEDDDERYIDIQVPTTTEQLTLETIYLKHDMVNIINYTKGMRFIKNIQVSSDKLHEDILKKLKDDDSQPSDFTKGIMNIISKTLNKNKRIRANNARIINNKREQDSDTECEVLDINTVSKNKRIITNKNKNINKKPESDSDTGCEVVDINTVNKSKRIKTNNKTKIINKKQKPDSDTEGEMLETLNENDIASTYDVPLRSTYEFDPKKFYMIEAYKIKWLTNITRDGGAQARLIELVRPDEIIIKSVSDKLGQLWAIIPATTLIDLLAKNRGIYEVFYKYPRKVYFDIDKIVNDCATDTFNDYINQLTTKLSDYFPHAEYSISGSCCNIADTTSYKISAHIVINNYIIENVNEHINLHELVKYLNTNYDEGFDIKVYNIKSQNFKCVNQSKPDGRIQKIILNDYVSSHLISCFLI